MHRANGSELPDALIRLDVTQPEVGERSVLHRR
jgi:hypothetical protein